MTLFDKFDEYVEELLLAQYRVSEIIEHLLTRGEIREEFLIHQMLKQYKNLQCYTGIIAEDEGQQQSGQIDIIITKPAAQVRNFGNHSLVSIEDAVFIIEVKSNAHGTDFTKLEEKAQKYKGFNAGRDLAVGIFCYYYELKMKTILKRFGFTFDNEVQGFEQSFTPIYGHIDFAVALDNREDDDTARSRAFFIMKDKTQKDTVFQLYQDRPVSKHFFKLLKRSIS